MTDALTSKTKSLLAVLKMYASNTNDRTTSALWNALREAVDFIDHLEHGIRPDETPDAPDLGWLRAMAKYGSRKDDQREAGKLLAALELPAVEPKSPRTVEEDFQHFLSYSGKRGQNEADLQLAYYAGANMTGLLATPETLVRWVGVNLWRCRCKPPGNINSDTVIVCKDCCTPIPDKREA